MMETALNIALIGLSLCVLCGLYRLFAGPTIPDRVLGVDAVALSLIGMILVISIQKDTSAFIDILLLFSILGFVTTIAVMDSFLRNHNKQKP